MTSLWHETATLPRFPALNRDATCDVLVIGGGMAGLLTLYELRRRGVDCLLIEADRIGSGTTGGTTAVLTAQHDTLYSDLIRCFGRNPQEHSWDCACHGSRYAPDGRLLDNPALRDRK